MTAVLAERSVRAVWHPCTQMQLHEGQLPVAIARAQGPWLYGADGTKFVGSSTTAIQPLVTGGNAQATQVMEGLRARHLGACDQTANGSRRHGPTAHRTVCHHTDRDVQRLVAALAELVATARISFT